MPLDADLLLKKAPNGFEAGGPVQALLSDLQGNVLQAHARKNAVHLFLSFNANTIRLRQLKSWVRWLGNARITSAWDEYCQQRPHRTAFCSFLLSGRGYEVLNLGSPDSVPFRMGMARRGNFLNDPPLADWEEGYRSNEIHALLVLANNNAAELAKDSVDLRVSAFAAGASVVVEEWGGRLVEDGRTIEHFGYTDGISQPRFFPSQRQSRRRWDTLANLNLALIEEPQNPGHFGSLLVFRKLEQNVLLWEQSINRLAETMSLEPELVGAFAVGRFKDGTPVVEHNVKQNAEHPANDFNYSNDPGGLRCPFQAHIRKTNPRGEEAGSSIHDEREHRIVRRGITYGVRPDLHPVGKSFPPPHRGVGLLFMCYQANIENQFEYIQGKWANNPNYPYGQSGLDVVIGQAPTRPASVNAQQLPIEDGQFGRVIFDFKRAVKLLGGEYFFAPSISTFQAL